LPAFQGVGLQTETPGVFPIAVSVTTVHDCPVGQSASVPHEMSDVQLAEQEEPVSARQHCSVDMQPFAPPQVSAGTPWGQVPARQPVPVNTPRPVRISQHDSPDAQSSAASHANFTLPEAQVFVHCSVLVDLS
jgi:hypothetical protein